MIPPRKPRFTIPKDPWDTRSVPIDPVNQLVFIYKSPRRIDPDDAVIHAMILCAPEEDPDDPEYIQSTIHHFRSAATGDPIAETATCHRRLRRPKVECYRAESQVRSYQKKGFMVHEEQWIADLPYSEYTIGTDPANLGIVRLRFGHRAQNATKEDRYPKRLLIPSPERTGAAFDAHHRNRMLVKKSLTHYKLENPDDDLAKLAE